MDQKLIYYKALDSFISTIQDRFDQPTFKLFAQVEQLFLKAVVKQDVTDGLKLFENHLEGDDVDLLTAELPTILE